jgi:DNA-binding GntR family transcriptional regulator
MQNERKRDTGASADVAIKRPNRLGDEVYDVLYRQLMSLDIPPGSRISIDNLVRELGVSQTPIREALSRLEAQGLVEKAHLIGYSAAPQITRSRLEGLYDLRDLLEPYAAGRAATNMTSAQIEQLGALDAEMKTIQPGSQDAYGTFARLDGQFHDLIAAGSGNQLAQDALARLQTHIHLFRLFYLANATTAANSEHDAIVQAIQSRDAAAAEQAMRKHIQMSRERFSRS